jgi:hypothetical protein
MPPKMLQNTNGTILRQNKKFKNMKFKDKLIGTMEDKSKSSHLASPLYQNSLYIASAGLLLLQKSFLDKLSILEHNKELERRIIITIIQITQKRLSQHGGGNGQTLLEIFNLLVSSNGFYMIKFADKSRRDAYSSKMFYMRQPYCRQASRVFKSSQGRRRSSKGYGLAGTEALLL